MENTVESLIKDIPNKGHPSIKDTFLGLYCILLIVKILYKHCTKIVTSTIKTQERQREETKRTKKNKARKLKL